MFLFFMQWNLENNSSKIYISKTILVAKRWKLSHGSAVAPEIVSYSTIEADYIIWYERILDFSILK